MQGSSLQNSAVVRGMVFKKSIEGTITKKTSAKVAVFTCPVDVATTETSVLISLSFCLPCLLSTFESRALFLLIRFYFTGHCLDQKRRRTHEIQPR